MTKIAQLKKTGFNYGRHVLVYRKHDLTIADMCLSKEILDWKINKGFLPIHLAKCYNQY